VCVCVCVCVTVSSPHSFCSLIERGTDEIYLSQWLMKTPATSDQDLVGLSDNTALSRAPQSYKCENSLPLEVFYLSFFPE